MIDKHMAQRQMLRDASKAVNQGKAVSPAARDFVAYALLQASLGKAVVPTAERKTGARTEAETIALTGTSRPLRLAIIVELLRCAGVSKTEAVSTVAKACEAHESSVWGACKEWESSLQKPVLPNDGPLALREWKLRMKRDAERDEADELQSVLRVKGPYSKHSKKLQAYLLE